MEQQQRTIIQQALEALETEAEIYRENDPEDGEPEYIREAITDLRQLLEQPDAWVGLTEEERRTLFNPLHDVPFEFARAIEAKLKEKNT